jgi:hypothetical protein
MLKLSLPIVACLLLEVIVLANFGLYYNAGMYPNQGVALQDFSEKSGSLLLGWNSTMPA